MLKRTLELLTAYAALNAAVYRFEVGPPPLYEAIFLGFFNDLPEMHDPGEFASIKVEVAIFVLVLIKEPYFKIP